MITQEDSAVSNEIFTDEEVVDYNCENHSSFVGIKLIFFEHSYMKNYADLCEEHEESLPEKEKDEEEHLCDSEPVNTEKLIKTIPPIGTEILKPENLFPLKQSTEVQKECESTRSELHERLSPSKESTESKKTSVISNSQSLDSLSLSEKFIQAKELNNLPKLEELHENLSSSLETKALKSENLFPLKQLTEIQKECELTRSELHEKLSPSKELTESKKAIVNSNSQESLDSLSSHEKFIQTKEQNNVPQLEKLHEDSSSSLETKALKSENLFLLKQSTVQKECESARSGLHEKLSPSKELTESKKAIVISNSQESLDSLSPCEKFIQAKEQNKLSKLEKLHEDLSSSLESPQIKSKLPNSGQFHRGLSPPKELIEGGNPLQLSESEKLPEDLFSSEESLQTEIKSKLSNLEELHGDFTSPKELGENQFKLSETEKLHEDLALSQPSLTTKMKCKLLNSEELHGENTPSKELIKGENLFQLPESENFDEDLSSSQESPQTEIKSKFPNAGEFRESTPSKQLIEGENLFQLPESEKIDKDSTLSQESPQTEIKSKLPNSGEFRESTPEELIEGENLLQLPESEKFDEDLFSSQESPQIEIKSKLPNSGEFRENTPSEELIEGESLFQLPESEKFDKDSTSSKELTQAEKQTRLRKSKKLLNEAKCKKTKNIVVPVRRSLRQTYKIDKDSIINNSAVMMNTCSEANTEKLHPDVNKGAVSSQTTVIEIKAEKGCKNVKDVVNKCDVEMHSKNENVQLPSEVRVVLQKDLNIDAMVFSTNDFITMENRDNKKKGNMTKISPRKKGTFSKPPKSDVNTSDIESCQNEKFKNKDCKNTKDEILESDTEICSKNQNVQSPLKVTVVLQKDLNIDAMAFSKGDFNTVGNEGNKKKDVLTNASPKRKGTFSVQSKNINISDIESSQREKVKNKECKNAKDEILSNDAEILSKNENIQSPLKVRVVLQKDLNIDAMVLSTNDFISVKNSNNKKKDDLIDASPGRKRTFSEPSKSNLNSSNVESCQREKFKDKELKSLVKPKDSAKSKAEKLDLQSKMLQSRKRNLSAPSEKVLKEGLTMNVRKSPESPDKKRKKIFSLSEGSAPNELMKAKNKKDSSPGCVKTLELVSPSSNVVTKPKIKKIRRDSLRFIMNDNEPALFSQPDVLIKVKTDDDIKKEIKSTVKDIKNVSDMENSDVSQAVNWEPKLDISAIEIDEPFSQPEDVQNVTSLNESLSNTDDFPSEYLCEKDIIEENSLQIEESFSRNLEVESVKVLDKKPSEINSSISTEKSTKNNCKHLESDDAKELISIESEDGKPIVDSDKPRAGRKSKNTIENKEIFEDSTPTNSSTARKSSLRQKRAEKEAAKEEPKQAKKKSTKIEVEPEEDDDDEEEEEEEEYDDPTKPWCICRKPHGNRFMIMCDRCDDWFHGSCVGVSKQKGRILEKFKREWICPNCNKKDIESASVENSTEKKSEPEIKKMVPEKTVSESKNTVASVNVQPSKNAVADVNVQPSKNAVAKVNIQPSKNAVANTNVQSSKHVVSSVNIESPKNAVSNVNVQSSKNAVGGVNVQSSKNVANINVQPSKKDKNEETSKSVVKTIQKTKVSSVSSSNSATSAVQKEKTVNPIVATKKSVNKSTINTPKVAESTSNTGKVPESESQKILVLDEVKGNVTAGDDAPSDESICVKVNPNFMIAVSSPSASSPKIAPKKKQASNTTKEKSETSAEAKAKVRSNVHKTLTKILMDRIKNAGDIQMKESDVSKVAGEIETELGILFKDNNFKYRAKYRSLMFNIKDPRNQGLFRKILNGSIPPDKLVRMSPEELASMELAKWREQENQHSLDMIKRLQLEQPSGTGLLKKTHKGEVEIEDDFDVIDEIPKSSVRPITCEISGEQVQEKELEKETEKEKEPEKEILKDTTSQHRSHLFDLHCKICTKKLPPRPVEDNKPKKFSTERKPKKFHVDYSTPVDRSHPAERPVARVVGRKPALPRTDEPLDHEPISIVKRSPNMGLRKLSKSASQLVVPIWKGCIFMHEVSKFSAYAFKVSGDTAFDLDASKFFDVCGRIPPDIVWEYLKQIKQIGNKELIIIRFRHEPGSEAAYEFLFQHLVTRKRYGVIKADRKSGFAKHIKDFYILPLAATSPVPIVLLPFDGPGLPTPRNNLLIGVIVRHKVNMPYLERTLVNPPVFRREKFQEGIENVYMPPLEPRSYTPPLPTTPAEDSPTTTIFNNNAPVFPSESSTPLYSSDYYDPSMPSISPKETDISHISYTYPGEYNLKSYEPSHSSYMPPSETNPDIYEPPLTPPLHLLMDQSKEEENKPYYPEQEILIISPESKNPEYSPKDDENLEKEEKMLYALRKELEETDQKVKELEQSKSDDISSEYHSPENQSLDINSVVASGMSSFLPENNTGNTKCQLPENLQKLLFGVQEKTLSKEKTANKDDVDMRIRSLFQSFSKSSDCHTATKTNKHTNIQDMSASGTSPPDEDQESSVGSGRMPDPRIKIGASFQESFSEERASVSPINVSVPEFEKRPGQELGVMEDVEKVKNVSLTQERLTTAEFDLLPPTCLSEHKFPPPRTERSELTSADRSFSSSVVHEVQQILPDFSKPPPVPPLMPPPLPPGFPPPNLENFLPSNVLSTYFPSAPPLPVETKACDINPASDSWSSWDVSPRHSQDSTWQNQDPRWDESWKNSTEMSVDDRARKSSNYAPNPLPVATKASDINRVNDSRSSWNISPPKSRDRSWSNRHPRSDESWKNSPENAAYDRAKHSSRYHRHSGASDFHKGSFYKDEPSAESRWNRPHTFDRNNWHERRSHERRSHEHHEGHWRRRDSPYFKKDHRNG